MSSLVATPQLVSMLAALKENTEIRDPNGVVIGVFIPVKDAELARAKALFNWNEIKRIAATERTGRTLTEILSELESGRKQA